MLGIGITTRNRHDLLMWGITKIAENTPEPYRLVIVDDASDKAQPPLFSLPDLHFAPKRLGIAKAKTACLWHLYEKGCDPIVLLDDDCYPVRTGWNIMLRNQAAKGKIDHLIYAPIGSNPSNRPWDTHYQVVRQQGELVEVNNCSGVMMWLTRHAVETVGAFNEFPGPYGYEHAAYTQRAWRAGLMGTWGPYVTVANLGLWLWSVDFQGQPTSYGGSCQSSMSTFEANQSVKQNDHTWQQSRSGPIHLPLYNPMEEEQ